MPSRSLSFAEAKPKVIAQIQREQAAQLMQTKAVQVQTQVRLLAQAGLPVAEAATKAGAVAEDVPTFTLRDASKVDVPDFQTILQACVGLPAGQISEFKQTESGGLFVYMKKRQLPDKAEAEMGESLMKPRYQEQKELAAFVEWLRICKDNARMQFVKTSA